MDVGVGIYFEFFKIIDGFYVYNTLGSCREYNWGGGLTFQPYVG